jgi:hypothetical protein
MKLTKEITFCEYCDKIIYRASPPPKEQYDNGEIIITDGSVLIPDEIVNLNQNSCHSKDISGYYCDIECLINHLKKILHLVEF